MAVLFPNSWNGINWIHCFSSSLIQSTLVCGPLHYMLHLRQPILFTNANGAVRAFSLDSDSLHYLNESSTLPGRLNFISADPSFIFRPHGSNFFMLLLCAIIGSFGPASAHFKSSKQQTYMLAHMGCRKSEAMSDLPAMQPDPSSNARWAAPTWDARWSCGRCNTRSILLCILS